MRVRRWRGQRRTGWWWGSALFTARRGPAYDDRSWSFQMVDLLSPSEVPVKSFSRPTRTAGPGDEVVSTQGSQGTGMSNSDLLATLPVTTDAEVAGLDDSSPFWSDAYLPFVDPVDRAINLKATADDGKGGTVSPSVDLSNDGFKLGYNKTDAKENSVTQSFGVNATDVAYTKSTADAKEAGKSNSFGFNRENSTVKVAQTTSKGDADKNSTSIQAEVGVGKLGAGYLTGPKNKQSGGSFFVSNDTFKASGMRNGFGVGVENTDHSLGGSISLPVTNTLGFSANGSYDNGGTCASNDDVFKAGVALKTKTAGANLQGTYGNGTSGGSIGGNVGPFGLGGGGSITSRTGLGYEESGLLGPSSVAQTTSGSGIEGNAKFFVGANGSSSAESTFKVQHQHDATGGPSYEGMQHLESVRSKVVDDGLPLSVADLGMHQGFEMNSTSKSESGISVDPVVLDASDTGSRQSATTRAMARTPEGIRIRDSHQEQSGSKSSVNWGLGWLHTSDREQNGMDTQVVDYLLDANDPNAVNYAEDYAQLGLLPNWDVVAPEELVVPLKAALLEVRSGPIDKVRWQDFLRKNGPTVEAINDSVRGNALSKDPTASSGVHLLGASRSDDKSYSQSTTTAVLFSSSSSRDVGVKHHRHPGSDGSMVNETTVRRQRDGAARSVTTSGGLGAGTALRIEDQAKDRNPEVTFDLSPQVVQAIGEHINEDELQSGKAWHYMAKRASTFWMWFGAPMGSAPKMLPPTDDQGLLNSVPADKHATLGPIFAAITGPEDFKKLPPELQVVFIESSAYMDTTIGLEEGKKEERPGNHFDSLAAVAVMDDPEFRDAAMFGLGRQMARDGRDPGAELGQLGNELGGGAVYLLDEARAGRQADAGVLSGNPEVWVKALEQVLAPGEFSDAHAILRLTRLMREQGGPSLLSNVFKLSSVKALSVALMLAAHSVERPREFIQQIMVGTDDQKALDAWWKQVEANLQVQEEQKEAAKLFALHKHENVIDGDRGLGGVGMDRRQVDGKIMQKQQQQRMDDFLKSQKDRHLDPTKPKDASADENVTLNSPEELKKRFGRP
jgi:hypothetical protein